MNKTMYRKSSGKKNHKGVQHHEKTIKSTKNPYHHREINSLISCDSGGNFSHVFTHIKSFRERYPEAIPKGNIGRRKSGVHRERKGERLECLV